MRKIIIMTLVLVVGISLPATVLADAWNWRNNPERFLSQEFPREAAHLNAAMSALRGLLKASSEFEPDSKDRLKPILDARLSKLEIALEDLNFALEEVFPDMSEEEKDTALDACSKILDDLEDLGTFARNQALDDTSEDLLGIVDAAAEAFDALPKLPSAPDQDATSEIIL